MLQKSEIGRIGEDIACEYLVENGYKILCRNFRKPWGELDIIAKSPDKTLIFVEVKTIQQSSPQAIQKSLEDCQINEPLYPQPEPEMQMTSAKIKKLKRAASLYAGHYPELIKENKGWRIDVLALTVSEAIFKNSLATLAKNKKDYLIRHYQNIS